MPDVDTAIQFLATVVTGRNDVPKDNPSAAELHAYTIKVSLRDTAKRFRYIIIIIPPENEYKINGAGFLQLLFLAGAIGHPIQQNSSK